MPLDFQFNMILSMSLSYMLKRIATLEKSKKYVPEVEQAVNSGNASCKLDKDRIHKIRL